MATAKKSVKAAPQEETRVVPVASEQAELQKAGALIESREISAEDTFKGLTKGQIALIKRTLAPGADNDELLFFINVCKGAGLNPFLKQAYFIKRWNAQQGREVGQVQIGIDGYRAIAEGTGAYAGSDDAVFELDVQVPLVLGKMDELVDVPKKATVTVWKIVQGVRVAFTASARWSEYEPRDKKGGKLSPMWQKMPYGQLAKCAEALALRKAFPKLLGGFYTPEEMAQAAKEVAPVKTDVDTAIAIVGKVTKPEELDDVEAKMKASDKYSATDKKKFLKAITDRRKELAKEDA